MNKLPKLLILSTSLLAFSACSNIKNFYDTRINPPTKLNYNIVHETTPTQAHLADNLVLMSEELASFERHFDLINHPPQSEDLSALFGDHPWLSGAIVINKNGTIAGSYPEIVPPFDFEAVLSTPKKMDERAIRANVQGDNIIIAKPVFSSTDELLGLSMVYFDIKKLAQATNFANDILVIAGNDNIVLSGHTVDEEALNKIAVNKLVQKNSSGSISDKEFQAFWIARYIFNYPLVFIIQE